MFYKKTINAIWEALQVANLERREINKKYEQLEKCRNAIADVVIEHENKIDALIKSNETYKECIEELQKHAEAIAAIVNSDRRDINALIQEIRKLKQTKGKK